jgi:hypothetical protein
VNYQQQDPSSRSWSAASPSGSNRDPFNDQRRMDSDFGLIATDASPPSVLRPSEGRKFAADAPHPAVSVTGVRKTTNRRQAGRRRC